MIIKYNISTTPRYYSLHKPWDNPSQTQMICILRSYNQLFGQEGAPQQVRWGHFLCFLKKSTQTIPNPPFKLQTKLPRIFPPGGIRHRLPATFPNGWGIAQPKLPKLSTKQMAAEVLRLLRHHLCSIFRPHLWRQSLLPVDSPGKARSIAVSGSLMFPFFGC